MKLFSTAIAIFFGLIVFWNANAAVLTRPPNNLGLVGSWPMNEGPSTQAGDFSGNNNHGTLTQMDPNTDWVNGKRGKALDFDGSDDFTLVQNSSNLEDITENSFTVTALARPDQAPPGLTGP